MSFVRVTIFVCTMFCCLSCGAQNREPTGNDVVSLCGMRGANASICDSVFLAAVEGMSRGDIISARSIICLPSGVTVGQLVELSKRELNAFPENWHLPLTSIISLALFKAFPCVAK